MPLKLEIGDLDGLTTPIELGATRWRSLEQEEVDSFARLTGDRNPIHVDPDHARRMGFEGTIAHGYLGLALLAPVFNELIAIRGPGLSLNYGLDRVRFPAPLPVGREFRGSGHLAEVTALERGFQLAVELRLEVRAQERPAVVARCLSRFYR